MLPCEIESLEENSGTKPFETADWSDDIALDVQYRVGDGQGYEWNMRHSGSLEFDDEGDATGWGKTGWRVDQFLQDWGIEAGYDNWPDMKSRDPYIPNQFIDHLKGMKGMMLKYVVKHDEEGKYFYNHFRFTVSLDKFGGDEKKAEKYLIGKFLKNVEKGFPKDYDPGCIEDDKTAPKNKPAEAKQSSPPEDEEDDFPF